LLYHFLITLEIIRQADGALFNQAAQVWNHTFYWNSLSPTGGREPFGDIATRIEKDFGSFSQFKDLFTNTCLKHFGSGWVWLYEDKACKQLKVMSTSDANTPLRLVCFHSFGDTDSFFPYFIEIL
jgi:superoxide dismutase, Fe-Mn family